ncbi:MAG: serine/threonine protein kinase [Chloroflexi bacterium]|jgi:serine/threonine-protein kinase|uniref:serine/threonine protein kinase n=1 Tax=Candidatus Roseilinea sp. NK_OTU-006 TaxID=2704250 RepID=UPI000F1D3843|nr:serine/threonine-protein kinase [Candidatus Roseilinea sp. NK_OTU-006]RMG62986.1 MAG: serine/threonine protein kinase [Chloroflexota bacterium]
MPNKYNIDRIIWQGRLNEVCIAYDQQNRRVALKRPVSSDEATAKNFRRELNLLLGVKHPNIVSVLEYSDANELYYTMPWLDGESLEARVNRQRCALPPAEVCQIVTQIAEALKALHEKSIVHRDVTPANIIMLDNHNQQANLQAVLIDFSLARRIGMRGMAKEGTPLYCAPEQWKGKTPAAPSADVYALGAVAYFALCGRPPRDVLEPADRTVEQPIRPLHKVNRAVPRPVSDVVMRAMANAPDKRWKTASEFAQRLEEAVNGQTGRQSKARAATGRPLAALGGLLAALALVVALASGAWLALSRGSEDAPMMERAIPTGLPPFVTVTPRETRAGTASVQTTEASALIPIAMDRDRIRNPQATVTLAWPPTPAYASSVSTVTPIPDAQPAQEELAQTPPETPTPQPGAILELRGVSGQERWGMPTSADGCSQFNDRQPVWRYKVSLTIRNVGKTALTNWSVKLFNQGSPLNTCLLYGSYSPILPGQTASVEVAAFLTAEPAVQARVISGGKTWRLCFKGTAGIPC